MCSPSVVSNQTSSKARPFSAGLRIPSGLFDGVCMPTMTHGTKSIDSWRTIKLTMKATRPPIITVSATFQELLMITIARMVNIIAIVIGLAAQNLNRRQQSAQNGSQCARTS